MKASYSILKSVSGCLYRIKEPVIIHSTEWISLLWSWDWSWADWYSCILGYSGDRPWVYTTVSTPGRDHLYRSTSSLILQYQEPVARIKYGGISPSDFLQQLFSFYPVGPKASSIDQVRMPRDTKKDINGLGGSQWGGCWWALSAARAKFGGYVYRPTRRTLTGPPSDVLHLVGVMGKVP